jgi:hypothetical protein
MQRPVNVLDTGARQQSLDTNTLELVTKYAENFYLRFGLRCETDVPTFADQGNQLAISFQEASGPQAGARANNGNTEGLGRQWLLRRLPYRLEKAVLDTWN